MEEAEVGQLICAKIITSQDGTDELRFVGHVVAIDAQQVILADINAGKVYLWKRSELDQITRLEGSNQLSNARVGETLLVTAHFNPPKHTAPPNSADVPNNVPENLWRKRYFLFHKFDFGIKLDPVAWYSVTPEDIARKIARRCKSDVVLDACGGAGGNAIQFAKYCNLVLSLDVDSNRLADAKHNAQIYEVADKIEFVTYNCIDFMKGLGDRSVDVVFLSPPWGGPAYREVASFSLKENIAVQDQSGTVVDGVDLFRLAKRVARKGVAYFLPRNVTLENLSEELDEDPTIFEVHYAGTHRPFTTCAYFGDFMQQSRIFDDKD